MLRRGLLSFWKLKGREPLEFRWAVHPQVLSTTGAVEYRRTGSETLRHVKRETPGRDKSQPGHSTECESTCWLEHLQCGGGPFKTPVPGLIAHPLAIAARERQREVIPLRMGS